jgi:hypothetical protein
MEKMTTDKKYNGLVISYYLSRCDTNAVRTLGFKNFTDACLMVWEISLMRNLIT